jgi:hypothetical protein
MPKNTAAHRRLTFFVETEKRSGEDAADANLNLLPQKKPKERATQISWRVVG